VEPGRAYAVYIRPVPGAKDWKPVEALRVDLPHGTYQAEWINVLDGTTAGSERFEHAGGEKSLTTPKYQDDIALRIIRAE
jgi:hypothetical protein